MSNFGAAATHWSRLSSAVQPQGFRSFTLANLTASDLEPLSSAVATAASAFTSVRERPEWPIIAQQLALLDRSAQFLSLRISGDNIELVVGRDDPNVDVSTAPEYVGFLVDLLASMTNATQQFTLSAEARQAVSTAAGTVGSDLVKSAADLLLPLLSFQGEFRAVIIFGRPNPPEELKTRWSGAFMVQWRPRLVGHRQAVACPWIWDTHGGITSSSLEGGYIQIANLNPASLSRNLQFAT